MAAATSGSCTMSKNRCAHIATLTRQAGEPDFTSTIVAVRRSGESPAGYASASAMTANATSDRTGRAPRHARRAHAPACTRRLRVEPFAFGPQQSQVLVVRAVRCQGVQMVGVPAPAFRRKYR